MNIETIEQRTETLRQTIIALVRRNGPDLSARQFGVFLTCYLESEAQTVRALAAKLSVSGPAISRALDRLSEFDLVRRKIDPLDRRSVLVQRTVSGATFLRDLKKILADAGRMPECPQRGTAHLSEGPKPCSKARRSALKRYDLSPAAISDSMPLISGHTSSTGSR
jgi:DNA-binding MarR family transcriptional regulator